jgi:urease gamma subunit
VQSVDQRIHELSARRQEIWSGAKPEPGEVERITKELNELYRERRAGKTVAEMGASRAEIVKRARVESELERLISR